MRYTRTAITQLTKMYRSVLKKCAFLNAIILAGVALPSTSWADYVEVSNWAELSAALSGTKDIGVTANIEDANTIASTSNDKTLNVNGKTISGQGSSSTSGITVNGGTLTVTGGGTFNNFYRPDTNPAGVDGSEYAVLDVRNGAALGMTGGEWTFSENTLGIGALNTLNSSISANVDKMVFENNISNSQSAGLRHQDSDNTYTTTTITAGEIVFNNNEVKNIDPYGDAKYGGGTAVMNSGGTLELLGNKNTFTDNKMNAPIPDGKGYKRGGGAVLNQSHEMSNGTNIDSTMVIGTSSSTNTFTGNSSSTNGGAIMNRAVDTDGDATLTINGNSTFTGNTAVEKGGAIYNIAQNECTAQVTLNDSSAFDSNTASTRGGAVYNKGTMGINNASFISNRTTSDSYPSQGGAIYNAGDEDYTNSYGVLTVSNSTFGSETDATKANIAMQGGAIANDKNNSYSGQLTLSNTNFYNNKAQSGANSGYSALGGALYNNGTATVNGATEFSGNTAEGYAAEGGAIYNTGTLTFNGAVTFDSNTVEDTDGANGGLGGALSNNGTLTFANAATFTNNKAIGDGQTSGGAINNDGTLTFENGATFTGNEAMYGGAIFNSDTLTLTDASFTNNTAGDEGGAIFQYGGTTNINAVNSNVAFSGNTADGTANDIMNYNGTINLNAASGKKITLAGGINGNSSANTNLVNVTGAGTVESEFIKNQTVAVSAGSELHLDTTATNGSNISGSTVAVASGAIINTIDSVINDYATGGEGKGTITLANGAIIKGDLDYVNGVADVYKAADGASIVYKVANALGADIQYGDSKTIKVAEGENVSVNSGTLTWVGDKDHGLSVTASGTSGSVTVTGTAGGINGAVENTDDGAKTNIDYTVTGNETFNGADNVIANSDFTITGQGTESTDPAITLGTNMVIGDANKPSTLTLENVKLADNGNDNALQNTAGSTLNINDSSIGVYVENHGTLVSDPTTYKNGIANYVGANATITGDTFSDINRSTENGGAIWNEEGGTLTLNADTFTNNTADNGGAIYNEGTATINGGTFTGNTATTNGGAIYSAADLTINGTVAEGAVSFTGNTVNNGVDPAVDNDIYMQGTDADARVTLALNAADDTNTITLNGGVAGQYYDMNINAATAGDVALGAVAGVDTITVGGGAVSATTVDANSLALNGGTFATTNASTIDTLTTAATTTFTAGNTLGVATALTNAGTLTANGALAVQSGSNSGTINGTGALTLGDGTTTVAFGNTGLISNAISNTAKSTFTTVGVDDTTTPTVGFTGAVANAGTLDVTAGTINSNVSGAGALKTADGVAIAAGKTVEQGALDVTGTLTNAGTLTVAGNITGSSTPTITGAGDINLNGGTAVDATAENAAVINSTGDVTIGGFVASTAAITAKDIAISAGKYLSIGANNLTDSNDASIANAGTLTLTGGTAMDATVTNANAVTGAGQTVISGYVTQTEGKAINNTAGISVTGGLVANASDLGAAVTNTGTVQLVGGQLDSTITGTGTTNMAGNITVKNDITQKNITVGKDSTGATVAANIVNTDGNTITATAGMTINEGSTVDTAADKLVSGASKYVTNDGTLTLRGTATPEETTTAGMAIKGTGTTNVEGNVTIGRRVTQNAVNVSADSQLINNNELNSGTTTVEGELINNSKIVTSGALPNNRIAINNGGSLVNGDEVSGFKATTVIGADIQNNGGTVTNYSHINANSAVTNTAGTLINAASGKISGNVENSATVNNLGTIVGNVVNNAGGAITTSASTIATGDGSTITNDGTLTLTSGTLAKAVTGDGATEVTGAVTVNDTTGSIAQDIDITAGSLTANADNLTGDDINIKNGAGLTLTGGELDADINGYADDPLDPTTTTYGALSVTGNTTLNGTAIVDALTVADDITLDADDDVTVNTTLANTGTITGAGDLTLLGAAMSNAGTISVASVIIGNGTDDAVITNAETGLITSDVFVDENAKLTTAGVDDVDDPQTGITGDIENDGSLELTGGTVVSSIDGNGTTEVTGDVAVDDEDGEINQAINITDGSLTANADNIGGNVTNDVDDGLTLTGGDIDVTIDGLGTTQITGDVTVDDTNGLIDQDVAITGDGSSLTANADNLGDDIFIDNDVEGGLNLTGGDLTSWIEGDGTTSITGDVTIDDDDYSIDQDMSITGEGSLEASADSIGIGVTVTNDVEDGLTLTGGDLAANIDGDGTTNITGNVILVDDDNDYSIEQAIDIAVNTGALTANADGIDGDVTNNGTLELTGGTLESDVSGNGLLATDADVTIAEGTIVEQNDLSVGGTLTNEGALTVNDSLDTAGAEIANDGDLTLAGANMENAGIISGDGTTTITGSLENTTGSIENDIVVADGASLTTAAGSVTDADGLENNGDLNLTGGTLETKVSGDGETEISGNTTLAAKIEQAIGVDDGVTLDTDDAGNIGGTVTMAGDNSHLDLGGGELSQNVTGGKLDITGDVTAGADIVVNDSNTTITGDGSLDIGTHDVTLGNTTVKDGGEIGIAINDLTNGTSDVDGGSLTVNGNLDAQDGSKLNLNIADGLLQEQHGQTTGLNLVNVTGDGAFTADQITTTGSYGVKINTDGTISIMNKDSFADVSSAAVAGNANNVATAAAWDNATNLAEGSLARAIQKNFNKISKTNPAAYVNALTNIAPTDTAMYQGIALEINNLIGEQVASRLSDEGMNSGDVFERQGAWVKALYNHAEQDSDRTTPGFTGKTKGIAFGLDGEVNENTTFGIGYSYTQTDADSLNRDIDITGHNIFAYGKYQPSSWFVRGMVNYGLSDYEEKSHVLGFVKTADYDVKNYGLRTYVGYDLPNGFTPEAGLRYTHLTVENYMDSLGQVVRTDDIDILTATLGVNFQKDVETFGYKWTPKAHFGITYDLDNDGADASVVLGNSAYNINGEALDRFGIEAGVGAEMNMGDWSLSAEYEYGYRDNFENHTGMLQLKYNF